MTQMTYILNRLYILTALAEMDFNFEFPLKCLQPWKKSAGDKLLSRWQRKSCRRQATFSLTAEVLQETSYFLADSGKAGPRWQRKRGPHRWPPWPSCCMFPSALQLPPATKRSASRRHPIAAMRANLSREPRKFVSKITMNPILIVFCFFYKCSSCLSPWSGPRPCSSSFALGRAGRFNYHHFRLLASFLGLTL